MKLLLFKTTLLLTFLAALTSPVKAGYQEEKEKEIDEIVKVFSLPFIMKQHTTAEKLAYLGHSDPRIFDLIEKQLLDSYLSLSDEYEIDWASWLAKALGFSGNKKYLSTLRKLKFYAPDEKLRKYADIAEGYSYQYKTFNQIIMNFDNENSEETISSEMNHLPLSLLRYKNMLDSDIPELHKLAAKRIYFEGVTDNRITRLVLFRIANPAPRTDNDTKKWLKKSLCNICRGFGSRASLGSRTLDSRALVAYDDEADLLEAINDLSYLAEVVVTGSRIKRDSINSSQIITTITAEDIEKSTALTTADVLRNN